MNFPKPRLIFAMFLVPLGCFCVAGCPLGGFNLPPGALEQQSVLGGNDQRLLFMRMQLPDIRGVNLLNPPANPEAFTPNAELRELDLTTGQTRVLTSGPSADGMELSTVTDGHWMAAVNQTDNLVKIVDLETGAESQALAGTAAQDVFLNGIDNGRLFGQLHAAGNDGLLFVMDLPAGEPRWIPANPDGGPASIALNGDLLAFRYFTALDLSTDFQEIPAPSVNIDLWNLADGTKQTLVTGISGGGALGFAGGRLIWTETSSDGRQTTVRAHDLQTSQTATLLELASAPEGFAYVERIGDAGLLVHRTDYSGSGWTMQSHETSELHLFDGRVEVLLEYTQGFQSPAFFNTSPNMIGRRVVYRDTNTGEWFIYDGDTGARQAIQPFAP